ncbi:MAG: Asp-tRNA(Asn)/Glu-tRNA(Gln) amidotransferase subunit GatB [Chloroflexi bacterium]|nr:Asp-tRNA(Asn)/Glu-tRNA(Gln) amidotransferase subunit GatB [Chloroflexota bacterium]
MPSTMYEPVIGLEVHVEMLTKSKMFCACQVVDFTIASPNTAVCPVCAGHPGTLPVLNGLAVEYGLRVAAALECEIAPISIFSRKNYFYPDLPKGYQITQYDQPLASNGKITLITSRGEKIIHIRRVHLEEDTGKLTHIDVDGNSYSLVDLNRAGVSLLEIVTDPDFSTSEEVRAYAEALRALVRYLGVNSGDLEKGVMRIEPNISVRPVGQQELGTKVEIKNLNSFRALERGVAYEINRQIELLRAGKEVIQETVGWDEAKQATFSQRSKEDAHDYRYFPEPDLPPLLVSKRWMDDVHRALPELPWERSHRFSQDYGLSPAESWQLAAEKSLGEYFESVLKSAPGAAVRTVYAWVTGELLSLMNSSSTGFETLKIEPKGLADLLALISTGKINPNTGKIVLAEMFATGHSAAGIVEAGKLAQLSDQGFIARLVAEMLIENASEVASYRAGKISVANFLFGQAMRKAGGKANPQVLRSELERQLQQPT